MLQEGGTADFIPLERGEIPPEPYEPHRPRLRGGDARAAHCSKTGHGKQRHAERSRPVDNNDAEICEIPAAEFHAARKSTRNARESTSATLRGSSSATAGFDFNNATVPNPWAFPEPVKPKPARPLVPREPVRRAEPEIRVCRVANVRTPTDASQVRRFADCYDPELRAYLTSRHISVGFLGEIDQFLSGHPEIASIPEGRTALQQYYSLPPLEAYKAFLRGYTRPARYIDGIVETDNFALPTIGIYQPLSTKHDTELVDFFDGFDFRHDIIDRVDHTVVVGMNDWVCGRTVPQPLRKLICYAIWGNPVDAYKFFEYSYQNDYMPHRYLPEHVILGHIPKPVDSHELRPEALSVSKRHGDVRRCMARANDQGVDVLDVLITEYRMALVRKGHRRIDIDDLVGRAKERLESERQDPTGVDIVDLIMDDLANHPGPNRHFAPNTNRGNASTYRVGTNTAVNATGPQRHQRLKARRAHGFLQAEGAELQQARAILVRLYTQEQYFHAARAFAPGNMHDPNLVRIRASRAVAERRYVNCLIRYLRSAKRMSAYEAMNLQQQFTRQRMMHMQGSHSNFLLSMYPVELY